MSRPPGTDNSDHTPDTVPGQFRPHPQSGSGPLQTTPPVVPTQFQPMLPGQPGIRAKTEFFHIAPRWLREPVQNSIPNFPLNFHPLARPAEYFLKRGFFDETKSFVSLQVFRFAPAIPGSRRAPGTFTHLLTHTHPHTHLTAIPAFPDAVGLAKQHIEATRG